MRITNAMMTNNFLSNLSGNLNRMSKYLRQETTGKAISDISDDPVATIKSLSARNKLGEIDRYQGNVKTADNWLTEVESALDELNKVAVSAYESAVEASSGTYSDDDLAAIAEEIGQLRDEVLSTANATIGGNYLFGGYNTKGTTGGGLPFTVDACGDLYFNGVNMSNEASAESISAAAAAAEKALSGAAAANSTAQSADASDYIGIYTSAASAASYVTQAAGAAATAAAGARDIASSADIAARPMADLLSGLSDSASAASEEAASAASEAAAAAETAKTAAKGADKAYSAWRDAVGTDGETEAEKAYQEASDAAAAACEAAKTASSAAADKAGGALSAADAINSVIKASYALSESVDASAGAAGSAQAAYVGGDFTSVAGAAENAAAAGTAAANAGAIFSSAAADIGDDSLAADIAAAVTAVQTAAASAADAASAVTDDASAAAAADAAGAVQTAVGALQGLLGGSDALYNASGALDSESTDVVAVQVGAGQTMQMSVSGVGILGRGSDNLYVILDDLYNALKSGAGADDLGDYIGKLSDAQSAVLSLEAEVGAKKERLDTLSARYEASTANYTQMRSDAEDADLAEAIMNYSTAKTVYEAALSSSSEMIQTSLLDFLK